MTSKVHVSSSILCASSFCYCGNRGGLLIFQRSAQVNPRTKQNSGVEVKQSAPPQEQTQKEHIAMNIQSSAFQHNQFIPSKYACEGEDINPPLSISDVPAGAKSLALIMDDPDAPMATWVHWLVWNINIATTEILENTVPQGAVEGDTSWNRPGYGGPCPPSGTHRYFFKLYALDTTLDLVSGADKSQLEAAMEGHIVAQAEFIGLYSRGR
jgi:Raf kinase inhibitor-like YbhB/YbcL family protein